jgi:DNA-binding MarR family transcriptional regulator
MARYRDRAAPFNAPASLPDYDRGLEARAARAAFRLGRRLNRHLAHYLDRAHHWDHRPGRGVVLPSRMLVVEAIAAYAWPNAVPVGHVAKALEVTASTASRLVDAAVEDDYVDMFWPYGGGKRRNLRLTPDGIGLALDYDAFQRDVFLQATAGWPEGERERFADRLVAFYEAIASAKLGKGL